MKTPVACLGKILLRMKISPTYAVIVSWICLLFSAINAETMPRFDMRDKDGIIFDPIAPRAGERLVAKCTLVGLTPSDKRHVRSESPRRGYLPGKRVALRSEESNETLAAVSRFRRRYIYSNGADVSIEHLPQLNTRLMSRQLHCVDEMERDWQGTSVRFELPK